MMDLSPVPEIAAVSTAPQNEHCLQIGTYSRLPVVLNVVQADGPASLRAQFPSFGRSSTAIRAHIQIHGEVFFEISGINHGIELAYV